MSGPLLIVEAKEGASPARADLLAFLDGKIAKWWTPDDIVMVEKIPLGATGKIDKVALRKQFKDYVLPGGLARARRYCFCASLRIDGSIRPAS